MELGYARITIYFEGPFWVGVFEREWEGRLEACKYTFGAEPRDAEVYALLLQRWRSLTFSPPVAAPRSGQAVNPKRAQRSAARSVHPAGVGTKAQQALKLQQEQTKQQRRTQRRARDEAEEARKFRLRQEKKKEKHRGR